MIAKVRIEHGKLIAELFHGEVAYGVIVFGEAGAVRLEDVRRMLEKMNYDIEEEQ